MKRLFFIALCCALCVSSCLAQDIVSEKNGTSVRIYPGEVIFGAPAGTVVVETLIDSERFIGTDVNIQSDSKVKYASNEKQFFIFPDPKVQQLYEYKIDGSLEDTVYLKEKTDLAYHVELTSGSYLVEIEDGAYKIVNPNVNETTDGYIVITKPVGIDSVGQTMTNLTYTLNGDILEVNFPSNDKGDDNEKLTYPISIDPIIDHRYDLKLLLHANLEPTAFSTSDFRDSSRYFQMPYAVKNVTYGQVVLNSTLKKYGNASTFMTYYQTSLNVADSPSYTFGTNNYSICGWLYWPDVVSATQIYYHATDANNYESLEIVDPFTFRYYRHRGGADIGDIYAGLSGDNPVPTDTWNQICVIQNGTNAQMYLNGTAIGSPTARSGSQTDLTGAVNIGRISDGRNSVYHLIDEVTVFNGGFAPTIDQLQGEYPLYLNASVSGANLGYADDNYTVALLHMNGANGGTIFTDQVGNRTFTASGSAVTSTDWYKFGPSSYNVATPSPSYLNTDIIDFASMNYGTDNYTIDIWINATVTPTSDEGIYGRIVDANNYEFLYLQPGQLGYFFLTGGTFRVRVYSPYPTEINKAHHVAVVKNGATHHIYIDGVDQPLTFTVATNGAFDFTGPSRMYIGTHPGVVAWYNFTGNIDELRISKGIARWTTNFTPPTNPYELILNVTAPTANPSGSGSAPATIQFTDNTPSSAWTANTFNWSFGDGGYSSLQNPSHTFTSAGVYTVVENIYNNNMTASATSTVPIGAPYVDFMGTPLAGTAAMEVTFTDLTTNITPITSYLIDFGDGTSSTALPPWTHVYSTFGAYSVNLTETNSIGTGYKYKRDYVVTSTEQAPILNPQTIPVTIHIQSFWGGVIADAIVSAQGYNTTVGNWEWLGQILSIPLDEYPINTANMTGVTDTNGDVVFLMVPSIRYNVTVSASGYTFPLVHINPSGISTFTIIANGNDTFFPGGNDTLEEVNVSVSWSKYNNTYSFVNVTYDDQTATTTGGTITVYLDTTGRLANASAIKTMAITGTTCSNSTLVNTPTGGASYRVVVNATTTDENIVRTFTHYFKGSPVLLPGFTSETILWLALFVVIFTAAFAGATHSPQMAVVLCVESWVFWSIGWLDYLISWFGYGEFSVIVYLVLATFLTIWWNIAEGKAKGKRSS